MRIKANNKITIEERVAEIYNGRPRVVFKNPTTVDAKVCTVTGVSTFDDTNTERVVTHKIIIDYIEGLTAERRVKIGNKSLNILAVENCCEKNETHKLMCTERGEASKVVNQS